MLPDGRAAMEPLPDLVAVATLADIVPRSLERLAPFGAGFQYPTFAVRGLRLTESRQMGGDGQHWRARFPAFGRVPVEAVWFDHSQLASQFQPGQSLDAAFRLKRTRFDGYWRLEMELLDVANAAN